ncbi:hypothetical protein V499_00063 [Pseudogymnoascus sp. VKM F-103]|uniref:FAD-binding PCMH-type domain-containing protein n=1 Tax=Pseudogymnoascus verrucosus TaxID=342668 RepID=A0A1B8GS33_9PEZI|nr:uncharacterized protein VE01_03596 [Pseudogymnoascus verrucosus]KFY81129.1 hypothetical protein V499_00063 [Pseudogymnoascus sp. VKM F-103]OBT98639.1 hypothetical protein VE01_03596 [Pseudogymnoascus verrucosus]
MSPIGLLYGVAFLSTLVTGQALVGPAACATLKSSLSNVEVINSILHPDFISSRYTYWNSRQSSYTPSCIFYPTSAQDISTAIKVIRTTGSRFAIKAGGHNPNDFFSSVDQGVLIDLKKMNGKSYDAETTLATYEPGNKFGDLYEFYAPLGRTVVGARLAGVGTGLALSGGLSFISPQYGMACDSFRSLEIVLPSGEIVTASPESNPDLFFASRGGGGNAYGVVTKYTVQSRPAGQFFAGNIFYLFEQTLDVLDAINNFAAYNTDPKASIIGTYEKLPTPDLTLNLDEFIIIFLVYDGPDAGDAFQNFTSIPSFLNTMSIKTYPEVTNMPAPMSGELSRGANTFRVAVQRVHGTAVHDVYANWNAWAESHKGDYFLISLDFQPVAKSLTDASNAYEGGNAMQMPEGPWMWINYLITLPPLTTAANYKRIQASFKAMVEAIPNAKGLPLFINDASFDQNPLETYGGYETLKIAKAKYDPEGFFSSKTGGWKFT